MNEIWKPLECINIWWCNIYEAFIIQTLSFACINKESTVRTEKVGSLYIKRACSPKICEDNS